MTIARRLLMAGGGAGALAPASPLLLSAAPSGGWVPISHPKAVAAGGHLFFGYADGTTGDVEVRDRSGGATSAAFNLHSALSGLFGSPGDDHAAPAILVRSSDSRLLVAYCTQGDTVMRTRLGTNPLDASAFAAEVGRSLGGSNYLYPMLAQLSGEGGRIYLFWKDFPGTTVLRQSTSDDGGATWSASARIYASGNFFSAFATDSASRMDYVVTDTAPTPGSANGLFHFYQVGGQLYRSDGTAITAAIPIGPSDATRIYSAGGAPFPYSIVYDGSGHPVVACAELGATSTYFELRWTGSAWVRHDIATSAAFYAGADPPGITHDSADPGRVILGRDVSPGVFEMFSYRTADGGVTWSGSQLTSGSGSSVPQTPVDVAGHAAGGIAVLWVAGPYTSDYVYSVGTVGTL